MPKNQPPGKPDRPRKKRPKPDEVRTSGDPLGKLVKEYGVNLAEVLVVAVIGGLIGGGLIWYALSREPDSLIWLLVGSAVMIATVVLLALSLLNLGRRLELRKHGVRWTEFGSITELAWGDIVDIEIQREEETNLGIASVHKRSSDGISSSGPLTKTEWDITIRGHDGRLIRLRPLFLRTVDDPKKLISQLRLGAGLR